ncbi:succinylglutamate desuccinylase/aspartoacylase family protein [Aeoliella sp. ICT_H6.2]|uniref:Succinylglutamate desuccinylase/aspartoacylase family protein n=1 Tax=Aeoliella straminimaris TaxID=2954799 RepID=A0A9X2JGW0_9BACT|nr:succinylglutamate desuccinylase/aspartoacylase family protein [Aeoliella straminimaris]MCO6045161.1 succinylglutamate desuccinylase/aspartoacylase family protein [Aeoliella straminimaris]
MKRALEAKSVGDWNGQRIAPGEARDIRLAVSESYSGMTVRIPIHVRRSHNDGPTVFVTAALHGDEINGTGAIRQLIQDEHLELTSGALVLVPVLNLLGFDRHSRYLPDRRDLNRSFPGSPEGSLASRMARTIFDEIVARGDYGIDLHTAAARRTNYPNVRGDLSNPEVLRIAEAFGCDFIINGKGPAGAFRREASAAGRPSIILEGGEVCKVEPAIVETAVRGVRNVLAELGMIEDPPERPDYQVTIEKTKWVRAERGGFLQFHVQPGEMIEQDQPLATNTNLLGHERSVLTAPFDAVVIGMTTLPAVSPGESVCHLGQLPKGTRAKRIAKHRAAEDSLEGRLVEELGTNVMVVEWEDEVESDD